MLSDEHARAVNGTAQLGLDADGNFVDQVSAGDTGAYLSRRSKGLVNNIGALPGNTKHLRLRLKSLLFY